MRARSVVDQKRVAQASPSEVWRIETLSLPAAPAPKTALKSEGPVVALREATMKVPVISLSLPMLAVKPRVRWSWTTPGARMLKVTSLAWTGLLPWFQPARRVSALLHLYDRPSLRTSTSCQPKPGPLSAPSGACALLLLPTAGTLL